MSNWRFVLGACAALAIASPALSGTALASSFLPPEHQQSDTHPTDPEPDAQVTGSIASVDTDARAITLTDGHRFKVPAWISLDRLQTGATVSVVYTPNPHRGTATVKTISII